MVSSPGQSHPPRAPLLPGEEFRGYDILEQMGGGGAGAVYRAYHRATGAVHALKVLWSDRGSLVQRCHREAEALRTIRHPHVVRVHDVVSGPFDTYLTMELVEGPTLRRVIDTEGPLPPMRAAAIARQLASALAVIHRAGMVHRDLKPSNVIVQDRNGHDHVTLIDFGLVKIRQATTDTRITQHGMLLGTPAYMAPEQVTDPTVYPAADLYALGVVIYEMLCGLVPYRADNPLDILEMQLAGEPEPLPDSQGVDRLALWLMEKKVRDRPARAEDLIDELDRILGRELPEGLFATAEAPVTKWADDEVWAEPSWLPPPELPMSDPLTEPLLPEAVRPQRIRRASSPGLLLAAMALIFYVWAALY